jgi:hypothetical protein
MAALTEDQQRAFGDRITEMYDDPDTAAALTAKGSGLNPANRLTALAGKQDRANKAELAQTKAKAALKKATEDSVAATVAYYDEASRAAGALAEELGADHALSREIRKLRPGMTNEAARGPKPPSKP